MIGFFCVCLIDFCSDRNSVAVVFLVVAVLGGGFFFFFFFFFFLSCYGLWLGLLLEWWWRWLWLVEKFL